MGEYIIRGEVKGELRGDGLIEPTYVPECEMVVASSLCNVNNVNETRIIPLRIWTFTNDVNIKKGTRLGEIKIMEACGSRADLTIRNIEETIITANGGTFE